jgi:hypothetical protein
MACVFSIPVLKNDVESLSRKTGMDIMLFDECVILYVDG